jgi:hypothetical protein
MLVNAYEGLGVSRGESRGLCKAIGQRGQQVASPDTVHRYRGYWWGTLHSVASEAGARRNEDQMNNVTPPVVRLRTEQPSAQDDDQREALEQSEKKATEQQPDNFKDKATYEKVIEIGPDMTDAPIQGIDPPERPSSR